MTNLSRARLVILGFMVFTAVCAWAKTWGWA